MHLPEWSQKEAEVASCLVEPFIGCHDRKVPTTYLLRLSRILQIPALWCFTHVSHPNLNWVEHSQVPRPTLGSRSGERTPWERLFFLPGPLAPKMLLLPPHTTYIIGFLCTWLGPGHRRNFWNSILAGATADLDAPPVCPLVRLQFVHSSQMTFFLNCISQFQI